MGIAQARLVNYYAGRRPLLLTRASPRPCLTSPSSVGSGPIRGLFIQPGVFGGELFVVSQRPSTGPGLRSARLPGRIWCGLPRRPLSL